MPLSEIRRSFTLVLCLLAVMSSTGEDRPFLDLEQIPQELPEAAPIELSIEYCVLEALAVNYDVDISRQSTRSSEAQILSARGEFEPILFGDAGQSSSSSLDTNDISQTTETESASLGVSTKLVTGTDLSLSADYSETDDDIEGSASVIGL